jgi:RNA polymerase sigma-70 factor (ECF subfamily)
MAVSEDTIVRLLMRQRVQLLSYIDAIVRDDHMAEDVFQDVCALAVTKRDQIESEEHLMRWIRQAARYRASYAMRQRFNQPMLFDGALLDDLDALWAEHDHKPTEAITDALRSCLSKLSPYARQLVNLRYARGLSGASLAEAVGRQLNTVYVALTRIHRNLGQCIRKALEHDA